MKLYLSLCLFLFISISSVAQTGFSVKGSVTDTSSKVKLPGTTICVLNAKDSIMRKFTYAKDDGKFAISGLPEGKFILLVSYPAYADYVERFTLDAAHPTHDFGAMDMQLKSKILKDVMVKGSVNAIKIKGDTTEFNAKGYVIQPNDKVEDLVRQFPGMQIDKDGKITANGKAINKVLVEGEEFFGDDPTLVTKNLRADMVAKVQMYDKKSDQATFTGIDDGKRTKVLNIVLKEDKKNGTFGKISGGVATRGYYEGQAILNRFKAKQKYSAYFTTASTGKTGLGFSDNSSLGTSGNNVSFSDDGGVSIIGGIDGGLDSFSGTYNGYGRPTAHNGGLHYDNKFNNDKSTVNTNYRIGGISIDGITNTITQQNLGGGALINTTADQTSKNSSFRNKIDASFLYKPDTISSYKFMVDGTFKNFDVLNNYRTESEDERAKMLNRNARQIVNNGDQRLVNVSFLYTHKFKKYGRSITWNVSEAYGTNYTKGFLDSRTDYFNSTTGLVDSTRNLNQLKTTNSISSLLNSNITYSEPISRSVSVVFNYGLGFSNSSADRRSFNQTGQDSYNDLDEAFSNNYRFLQTTNQFGANFNYKKKKITFSAGTRASNVDFKQTDLFTSKVLNRSFINWQPQANFRYSPSMQQFFSLYYSGSNRQPTLDQLQPVRDNTNPLNIIIGNAQLRPSFSHGLDFNYNSSKILSGSSTVLYAYISSTDNAIVNNLTTIKSTGRSTIQYVNLKDERPYNYYSSVSTNRKIKAIGASAGLGLNTNGSVSYNYVNSVLNKSTSYTYGILANISKYADKKYSLFLSGGPRYSFNKFSASPDNNNNAAGFSVNSFNNYFLPAKFIISSDISYSYNAPTGLFPAQYRTIWGATLSKSFLKGDNLKIAINAQDILNQNTSFFRNFSGNTTTQTTNNSIGRYILFSVTWDFTKFGTEPAKK